MNSDSRFPAMVGYREVLSLPGAAAFSGSGAVARLPQAMVGLGSVLLLTGTHHSYTAAGLVAGAISLAQGLVSPRISGLIDRRGQRRIVAPQLAVHVIALSLLIVAAERRASAWVLLLAAVWVGASLPQFGACARARWTALLAGDERMHAALSIESLIDEAVFIVGPVLVTTLATAIVPAAGLFAAIILLVLGGAMFLAQRATEPALRSVNTAADRRAIRSRGLLIVVGVFACIGMLFGLIEVAVVALTREQHHPGAAGIMLALWATGSLVCGTIYGARRWATPARRRFQLGSAAMAVGCVLIAAGSQSLPLETVALIVAGLANAPTLITGNTLVPDLVAGDVVTEAYTLLGVTVFAGIAIGSPVGGILIDHTSAPVALWASIVPGLGAVALSTVLRNRSGERPGGSR